MAPARSAATVAANPVTRTVASCRRSWITRSDRRSTPATSAAISRNGISRSRPALDGTRAVCSAAIASARASNPSSSACNAAIRARVRSNSPSTAPRERVSRLVVGAGEVFIPPILPRATDIGRR